MSSPWTSPDPARVVPSRSFAEPSSEPQAPPRSTDLLAAAITVVVTALAGAPVGLLWGLLAPRVVAERVAGGYRPVSVDEFIAIDGYLFGALVVAGLVTGLVVWRLAREHGPTVVPALAAGGLGAAYVAMRVGERIGADEAAAAAAAGAASVEVPLELGALSVLATWSAVALLSFLVAALVARRRAGAADPVS